MPPRIDLTGQRFGRLVVESFSHMKKNISIWNCICDCGNEKKIDSSLMKQEKTKSCGCIQMEMRIQHGKRNKIHGMIKTPEYRAWDAMKSRCLNKTHPSYKDYGGRNITIYKPWIESFESFYKDMGPRPSPQHSLDRIDNNKGYSKQNCRWTTKRIQMINQRPRNRETALPQGVYLTRNGKYYSQIRYGNKGIHLGTFDDPITAAEEYQLWKRLRDKAIEFEAEGC